MSKKELARLRNVLNSDSSRIYDSVIQSVVENIPHHIALKIVFDLLQELCQVIQQDNPDISWVKTYLEIVRDLQYGSYITAHTKFGWLGDRRASLPEGEHLIAATDHLVSAISELEHNASPYAFVAAALDAITGAKTMYYWRVNYPENYARGREIHTKATELDAAGLDVNSDEYLQASMKIIGDYKRESAIFEYRKKVWHEIFDLLEKHLE